ncbi:hypothetical protein [Thermofilum pendens]|uniref:Transcriptional regulator, Fis family n=1 Tax=Thermofilum pendens (strain DSM 2475 / Hrk 5) TaxID=368408 RepID=A1S0Z6_THEPD|nr:hypothetical protein [Thermofilum pendens]ABL79126.1 transcriptional regulator, Fis family [Thermofilum pendens Hrk 5]
MSKRYLVAALAALLLASPVLAISTRRPETPLLLNLTVYPPGLALKELSTTRSGLAAVFVNTADKEVAVDKLYLAVEPPESFQCAISVPPLLETPPGPCSYNSSKDPLFKAPRVEPGGRVAVLVALSGTLRLTALNQSEEAVLKLGVGNATLVKKLRLYGWVDGEAKTLGRPGELEVRLVFGGNSTARLAVSGARVEVAGATLKNLRVVEAANFSGSVKAENGSIVVDGYASPPASIRVVAEAYSTVGVGGASPRVVLRLGDSEKAIGRAEVPAAKLVDLKPLLGFLPYAYEVSVEGGGNGYAAVRVGPHTYNVTLTGGRGSLTLGEAFWPLLSSYPVEPVSVALIEGNATREYPAVPPGEAPRVTTGLALLAIILASAAAVALLVRRAAKLEKQCGPVIEFEL